MAFTAPSNFIQELISRGFFRAYAPRGLILAWVLISAGALPGGTIDDMAKECATGLPEQRRVYLEVGKFICRNHHGTTRFGQMLREEAQASFSRTAPFWVVTKDRAGELVAAGEFQQTKVTLPGSHKDGVPLLQLDGMVRGAYEVREGRIRVDLELVWADGRSSRSVSRWLKEDEQLSSTGAAPAFREIHDSTSRDRVLVHVLAHSFPAELTRAYPTTIQELKKRGFGFAIWKNIEDLLSEDPRFELVMESSAASRPLFERLFSRDEASYETGQKAGIIVLTSHFIKPEKVSRDEMIRWGKLRRENPHYPVQLRLEFYDLSKPRWPAHGAYGYAVIDGEDPVLGARKACEEAVRSLLSQLDRPSPAPPRKAVKITRVANRTGERNFDDLSFYTHVKLAQVLERTGRFNAVTDGFLETVGSMFPSLHKIIYDYELAASLLEIKDKAGASIKIGPFSRSSKESSAKIELQWRDLQSGIERRGTGHGKLNKAAHSILVEIDRETLLKKEGIWILDESDLGQAISQALEQAAESISGKL